MSRGRLGSLDPGKLAGLLLKGDGPDGYAACASCLSERVDQDFSNHGPTAPQVFPRIYGRVYAQGQKLVKDGLAVAVSRVVKMGQLSRRRFLQITGAAGVVMLAPLELPARALAAAGSAQSSRT